ncbi:HNH endonuclease [Microbacterium enclense]|uniref:HNH endonuclease n=1 Tax=Microbacterium enclense TaxID=993073 RepID=UPI0021A63769|nr:HNH endonuclease signature motif containing protein [Microbacterium enclense]MCT2084494.1 HNH endonuclease [Microbacterium enclense]
MSFDPSSAAPTGGTAALSAVLDDVLRTGADLAAAEVARTRALAAAGHLALDVMADRRAHARASEMALREVASELAAAENLSDRTVQSQIGRAMTLVDDYPRTLAAWEAGVITRAHVHAIVDVGSPLPVEVRGEFDLLSVATAEGLSPGRLRSRLAALAERLQPTTQTQRHGRGRDTRCVRIVTGHDGMSDLVATLPTVLAVGIYDRLSQQAHAVIDARDETGDSVPDERTTAQLRADILADLLLTAAPEADPTRTDDGPGILGDIRARVQVVVPALTMLAPGRENSDPAELVGHGPLDADTARALAETTALPWDRVVTHPVTGEVLHTDTYHRGTAIDRFLRARDRHCRWPGCTVPAIRAEVDHTHDYALGGATEVSNLAHLCQRHHTQKQFTRWRIRQVSGGVLEWTSPTGRTYTDEPLPYSPAVRFLPDDPPPPEPREQPAPF